MPAYYLEALTVSLGFIILLAEAFVPAKNKSLAGLVGAVGLTAILILTFFSIGPDSKPDAAWAEWPLWNFYQFDSLARFYKILALLTTALVLLMAVDYRKILARFTEDPTSEEGTGEFYSLPIFACAGMMWMASAKDLAGAFVALELVTITFYILVAFMRRNVGSLEAGVKFLILGALSTGFLVYGIAWVYGSTGTMSLALLPEKIAGMENTVPLLFGIALVLVALGFKVGAVPMQMWIPDVYQGAGFELEEACAHRRRRPFTAMHAPGGGGWGVAGRADCARGLSVARTDARAKHVDTLDVDLADEQLVVALDLVHPVLEHGSPNDHGQVGLGQRRFGGDLHLLAAA